VFSLQAFGFHRQGKLGNAAVSIGTTGKVSISLSGLPKLLKYVRPRPCALRAWTGGSRKRLVERECDMSEEVKKESGGGKKGMGLVLWVAVPVLAAGSGFAASRVLFPKSAETEQVEASLAPPGAASSSYLTFEPVTVNLNEGRLNRFLNVALTLQVRTAEEEEIKELLEMHRAVLRSWLMSYLSELSTEDVRGSAGQNRIRREIQAQFNSVLFSDGIDHIYDVLFEQFNVQ
jgi:flagellar basal body-associated protein FliL